MENLYINGIGNIIIRELTREEFLLYPMKWAADEGWNPGITDGNIFYLSDPPAHLGLEYKGQIIGSGSIMSYEGQYGFMGLFIVEKSYRNQGIGTVLWEYRRDTLKKRLKGNAPIGIDGVFDMQDFYQRGGFEFSHRNLRMQGKAIHSQKEKRSIWFSGNDFAEILTFDQKYFGYSRNRFLGLWLHDSNVKTLIYKENENILGYLSFRKCKAGYKIGALFADHPEIAERLLLDALSDIPGETFFLDIPEINPHAVSLAEKFHMHEVFGCARMYLGKIPVIPWNQIYGITTFELG